MLMNFQTRNKTDCRGVIANVGNTVIRREFDAARIQPVSCNGGRDVGEFKLEDDKVLHARMKFTKWNRASNQYNSTVRRDAWEYSRNRHCASRPVHYMTYEVRVSWIRRLDENLNAWIPMIIPRRKVELMDMRSKRPLVPVSMRILSESIGDYWW